MCFVCFPCHIASFLTLQTVLSVYLSGRVCCLRTEWASHTILFFRFGNSKAKNKKKPSTLCVSLNSLAAPLHHCYYFEVVVYTHFFSFFSLTLLSLSSSQHTLLPRTYTNAFALQIFSMQLPYMLFESVFFSFLLWREDIIWCSKHGKPWEMKQRPTNTSIGIVVCVREWNEASTLKSITIIKREI